MDMQSESIDKLAEALSKAQGAMEAAKHDHTMTGEKYTFRYASLASVHAAIRKPLADNALAYTQVLDSWEPAKMVLITTLMHASGQFMRSVFPLAQQQNMQAFGSALTYAKRYSLSAIVGISSDEDDDGQAASGKGTNNQRASTGNQRNGATPPPATQHRQPAPPSATMQAPTNGHGDAHGDGDAPLLIGIAAQAEINKLGLATFGQKTWLATKRAELVNAVAPEAKGKLDRLTVEEGLSLFDALRALADARHAGSRQDAGRCQGQSRRGQGSAGRRVHSRLQAGRHWNQVTGIRFQ